MRLARLLFQIVCTVLAPFIGLLAGIGAAATLWWITTRDTLLAAWSAKHRHRLHKQINGD